jgi:hypothetical protein
MKRPAVSMHRRRQMQGALYLGCITPLMFAAVALAIIIYTPLDALRRWALRLFGKRQGGQGARPR